MLFRELAPPRILRAVINVRSNVQVYRTYVYVHVSVEVRVDRGHSGCTLFHVRVLVPCGDGEDHGCALRCEAEQGEK